MLFIKKNCYLNSNFIPKFKPADWTLRSQKLVNN